jgi:type II secretory pathway pseudopilin PulG
VKHSSSSREAARNDAGMTLVEMMVTLLIIVGSITALLLIVVNGLKNQVLTERVDRATAATQAVISKARDADFSNLGYYASGDTGAAPAGAVILPVSKINVATGATGAAVAEQAVVLAGARAAWPTVFQPAVGATTTLDGVDSSTSTYVTWVPNADGSTPTSKRVTVVTKWAVSPNALTAACNTGGVKCTTQSLVRAATAADQDPYSGASPAQMCSPTGKTICEAYIRSGRVLDGATMASLTDTPEQVSDVELYSRTSVPASSVSAVWTWTKADGSPLKTVTENLTPSADGTEWKYVVPADAAGSAATTYKGDIRPGAVDVTFTAVMSGSAATAVRGAFWSYSPSDDAAGVTASISSATTWCSVAGTGTAVQFAVAGHSYGFTAATQNPSARDTVAALFTVTQGGKTRTVSVPATVGAVVSHDTVINGITVPGSPSATWTVTPPATERCDNRAVTLVVNRASDQTATPLPLRLPAAVSAALTTPSLTLSIVQATGVWSASWTTPAGATTFNVETTIAGVPSVTTGAATSATGTLALGQAVTLRIQAVAGGMVSAWSSASTVGRTTATPVVTASVPDGLHVAFAWPATPGATSYTVSYQIGSGGWTAPASTTAPTYTVDAHYSAANVNVQVIGVSPAGSSVAGTASGTTPLWNYPALINGWSNYGTWETARYTRTNQSVVVLEGLIHSGTIGVPVMVLPVGFRPSHTLIFEEATGNYGMVRMDITIDGSVYVYNPAVPTNAQDWLSLSGITFLASDAPFAKQAVTLVNGWTNYGGTFAPLTTTLDGLGRVHMQGLVNSGTLGDGTAIGSFPAAYNSDQYLHISTTGMDKFGLMGISAALSSVVAKSTTTAGWQSLQGMYYSAAQAGAWSNLTLLNGWARYPGFAAPQYTKASDGIVSLRGLITAGTAGTTVAVLPPGDRPSATLIFDVANSGHLARVDVGSNGNVVLLDGGDNTWLALESINFVAEQ